MDWNNQVGHRTEHIFPHVKVSLKVSWSAFNSFYLHWRLNCFCRSCCLSDCSWKSGFCLIEILKMFSRCLWCYTCFIVVWSFNWPRVNHFDLTTAGLRWGFLSYWQSSPSMQIWKKNNLVAKVFMMPRMGLVKCCNKSLWCIAQFPPN